MKKGKTKYAGYVIQTNGHTDSFEIYADSLEITSSVFIFYVNEGLVKHYLAYYPIDRTVINHIVE